MPNCPNCGAPTPALAAFCSYCGSPLPREETQSAVKEFAARLADIESARTTQDGGTILSQMLGKGLFDPLSTADNEKISLIKTFAVPSTVADILEFTVLAAANIDVSALRLFPLGYGTTVQDFRAEKAVARAWIAKLEQVHQQAELSFRAAPEFAQVETVYQAKQEEITRRHRRNKTIIIAIVSGYLALMALSLIAL